MLDQEVNRVASFSAAETFKHVPAGIDGKGSGLLFVEWTAGNEIAAGRLEVDMLRYDFDDIRLLPDFSDVGDHVGGL